MSVSVTKESVEKTFTDGNVCYSLAGGSSMEIYVGSRLLTTVTTDEEWEGLQAEITLNKEVAGKNYDKRAEAVGRICTG